MIISLQQAESKKDAKTYVAALKYAMLLCVNTNASKYVEMMCNFCIDMHCMSEQEREVYENFVLFRSTKNGKYIFSDRYIEWTMRDIRSYLGKYFTEFTVDELERILLDMNTMKEEKGKSADKNANPSNRRSLKLDHPFLETYIFCHDSHLWAGTPQAVKGKSYKKRGDMTEDFKEEGQLYSVDGEEKLYTDVLKTVSRGHEKVKDWFEKHHVRGNLTETARSRKVVNIRKPKINNSGFGKYTLRRESRWN